MELSNLFLDKKLKGFRLKSFLSCLLYTSGGGGLISGVATYIKDVAPSIEVVGVEASGARSMRAAFDHGYPVKLEKIDKFADGIAVQKVGAKTYEVARKYVDRLLGVDEGLISETLIAVSYTHLPPYSSGRYFGRSPS